MNAKNGWIVVVFALCAACGADSKGEDTVVVVDDEMPVTTDEIEDDEPTQRAGDAGTTPDVSDPAPGCGDGTLDPDEACDDGNSADKDGCSSECEIETVVLRNLEATLNQGDDLTRCGGDTGYACEANYGISLTLSNFTDRPIARISSIRVNLGDVELSSGGMYCEDVSWQVDAMSTSDIINLGIYFRGSRYELLWICNDPNQADRSSVNDDDLHYIESAEVVFEISGLLSDGAVWETTATTTIKDLR